MNNIEWGAKSIRMLPARKKGFSCQDDASRQKISMGKIVSTDPPYYDNIPYADLSDFFYVWLRRSLKSVYPELFATLAVPKAEELVAFAYRHDGKSGAEDFFLNGMTNAMQCIAGQSHTAFPVTIYYAFKQSETKGKGATGTAMEQQMDGPATTALEQGRGDARLRPDEITTTASDDDDRAMGQRRRRQEARKRQCSGLGHCSRGQAHGLQSK